MFCHILCRDEAVLHCGFSCVHPNGPIVDNSYRTNHKGRAFHLCGFCCEPLGHQGFWKRYHILCTCLFWWQCATKCEFYAICKYWKISHNAGKHKAFHLHGPLCGFSNESLCEMFLDILYMDMVSLLYETFYAHPSFLFLIELSHMLSILSSFVWVFLWLCKLSFKSCLPHRLHIWYSLSLCTFLVWTLTS